MYINTCTISRDNQFADLNDYNIENNKNENNKKTIDTKKSLVILQGRDFSAVTIAFSIKILAEYQYFRYYKTYVLHYYVHNIL